METKGITPSFTEKGAASCSAEFTQSNLLYIEEIFTACNDKLASVEMSGISYSTQCGTIGKMIEDMITLQCYATSAHTQVQEALDGPLFEDFSLNATETISRIKLEDITTENTFQMEEYTSTKNGQSGIVYQKQVKPSLTMRDFLDVPESGPVEMPMLKNVEMVSEFAALFQNDYDTMKEASGWDVDTCIEVYMTSGEFDHKMYQPVKTLISNILDMTIVKPLIESITGTEWITGEDLTDTERGWKLAGAFLDTITLGRGTMVLKGAGYTGKEVAGALAKNAAMDLAANTAVCTVDCIGTELGIPPQIQWILSISAGCMVSSVGSNFVLTFDDIGGKKVTKELTPEEFQEFLGSEVNKVLKNNTPDLDSLDTNALKNADGLNNIDEVPVEELEKLKKVQGDGGNINHGGRIIGEDTPVFVGEGVNELSKDGFGKLSGKSFNVTQKGIDKVKAHISNNGFDAYENTEMIKRLEVALKKGETISGADASYYMHELKESTLMQSGMAYEEAHRAALDFFEVSDFSVYHPDVIRMEPMEWNSAWKKYWNIE